MRKIKKALPIALIIVTLCTFLALGVSAETGACGHTLTYESVGDYRHAVVCEPCGATIRYEDHTFNGGVCIVCTFTCNHYDCKGCVVKDPTCTTSGTMEYTCQNCGDSYTETIPPSGHEYNEQYHAPTCSEKGWSNGVCAYCGDITYEEDYYVEYPPTGHHVYVDGKCSECGISVGDTCVHDFGYVSCGAETHISKCGKCGLSQGEEIDHIWRNRTQMEQGSDEMHYIFQYTCSVCKATKTQEESIACTDTHNWSYWKVDDQYHRQECMTCATTGETLPHRWDNGVIDQAPSLNVEGYYRYTCLDCNAIKEEKTPALSIEDVVSRCTEKEAVDLFTAIFFYGENGDYGKFQQKLMENTDVGYWYSKYFVTEIMYDITKKGVNSEFYKDFSSLYNKVMDMSQHDSILYNKGYNDAISSVIDKNPIQGLFQGMWSSLILFITTIGNGFAIGGVSLMSVFVTIAVLALVWFVIKLLKG